MLTRETKISNLDHKSCADITIQCLADSGITSWTSAFDRQISNAKSLGMLPDDNKVIRATLSDFSFVMQSSQVEGICVHEVFRKLGISDTGALVFIQVAGYRYSGEDMLAYRLDGNNYHLINSLQQNVNKSPDKRVSEHVWIRWDDLVDRSPFPRRTVKPGRKKSFHSKSYEETEYFKSFQPNPRNKSTGDCVVRAIAGTLEISWSEALDLLTSSGKTTVNTKEVYLKVLKEKGFRHHKPIIRNGRHLNGEEFCEEMSRVYHQGERIFAHAGRAHAAAIVPIEEDNGQFSYKIIDSWDSSKRTIGEFWVRPVKAKESEPSYVQHHNKESESSRMQRHNRTFHVGESINHPSFGTGIIIAVTSGVLTVDFVTSGVRRLGEAWARSHCTDIRTVVNSEKVKHS